MVYGVGCFPTCLGERSGGAVGSADMFSSMLFSLIAVRMGTRRLA
jgi:hypothetical protein